MWAVIGSELAAAVGIAISIAPIIGLIAILTGPRARTSGPGFALGWLAGVIGTLLLVVVLGGAVEANDPEVADKGVDLVALAFGLLFLYLAYRSLRNRPVPGELAAEPKWLALIDKLDPVKAFGIAAAVVVVNAKNLPLLLSTGADIARAQLAAREAFFAVIVLGIVASLGALIPVSVYLLGGKAADSLLDAWRAWLVQNNAVVMTVLFGILGVSKLGSAIAGLF